MLGINDTVIIAAALVGSLIAPVAVALAGGALLLCALAIAVLVVAWWALPRRRASHHGRATVGATSLEAHEPARPASPLRWWTAMLVGLLCAVTGCSPSTSDNAPPSSSPGNLFPSARPSPLKYVALGDSYSSAPLVPVTDVANGCFRSSANYPSLVAKELGAQLDDHTCGGAQTVDFHRSQFPDVPPQLAAVKPSVDLVTLGTGGNDQQVFAQLTRRCPELRAQDPDGSPCRTYMGSRGSDMLLTALEETRKRVTGLVREVRERAPEAQVIVVGYPQIISADNACSQLPLAKGDYAYAEEVNLALTEALRSAAEANDATYVDVWAASKGHDICSDDPWVNGSVSDQKRAAAYHPFAKEQAAVAGLVVAAIHD